MVNSIRSKEGNDIHRSYITPLKKLLLILIVIIGLSFFLIEGLIIRSASLDEDTEVDYMMVLGAGLFGDRPSPVLHNRLVTALEYAKEYPDVIIVVSGGQGPDELISEAEAMKRFLIKNGIDEDKIIKEDSSTSTMENLTLTKEVLKRNESQRTPRILIVTSEYHMFRSKVLAKRTGFDPYGKCAPTPIYPKYLKPYYFLREYFAVIKSVAFDRN